MRRRFVAGAAVLAALGVGIVLLTSATGGRAGAASGARAAPTATCHPQRLSATDANGVERALLASKDEWGSTLLRARLGPTYQGVRRYLPPLLLVGQPAGTGGRRLTDSGVYYLAFGLPSSPDGGGPVTLHVADGSEIVSDRADGPRLSIGIGRAGNERYGACLARLATPRLAGGYLPILETRYVDAGGVRYEQESFATRMQTGSLVSFVRLQIDDAARASLERVQVRLTPSEHGLDVRGNRLVRGSDTQLYFSAGARFDGSSLVYALGPGGGGFSTIYVARLERPARSGPLALDANSYAQARQSLIAAWGRQLAQGATFVVPEQRVMDAERNLLIQDLLMTWRYSIGNDYASFEYPESLWTAQVMGEYGFPAAARAIIQRSFGQDPSPNLYPNWVGGERLLASALYYRLFHDESFLTSAMPSLARYAAAIEAQVAAGGGLLRREHYASDLPAVVYGLANQAVAWKGLAAMAQVWRWVGQPRLAAPARTAATRLAGALRARLRASARRLADRSLFLPARLDGEPPYKLLAASRDGSYWNLVIPEALASGLIEPGSSQATGALDYLLQHGSRLLGLVRFNYYGTPIAQVRATGLPGYQVSGSDDVYALNVARFLADNDQPGQLVLTLYGQLAAGMTAGTFVSGEGATIAPVRGRYYRSMFLPPNSVSNAAFLETLRLMLIHETSFPDGEPRGLQLAYATPRAWLRPGARILVRQAPTSFGPISFSIESARSSASVLIEVPSRAPLPALSLRLRFPRGERIAGVTLDGHPYRRFDPATGTIDLSGHTGEISVALRLER